MGACSSLIRPSNQQKLSLGSLTYPRHCAVKIKPKAVKVNIGETPFEFILTDPIHLCVDSLMIENLEMVVSQCILPGIDPRGEFFKKCQDSCLMLSNSDSIFLALFDGHGAEGSAVVNYCGIYAERYYSTHWKKACVIFTQSDPPNFLTSLCESCNYDLGKMENQIDCTYSGR